MTAFEKISDAASNYLQTEPRRTTSAFAASTRSQAQASFSLGKINRQVREWCERLRDEPAIARVVAADEDGSKRIFYFCRAGTVTAPGISLASYRAPIGRLAAIPVGRSETIRLPAKETEWVVLERTTYQPYFAELGWDSRNSVVQAKEYGPLTVASLRELLKAPAEADEFEILEELLAEEEETVNVQEGLKRSALTAMELRDQPILDQFQDEIFRLPLDKNLVILGPPGTGKTTTLIRRLGQKLDVELLEEDIRKILEREPGPLPHDQSWLMFTPTALLKQYVKEAFAREGIPASEQRITTWADYSRHLARNVFGILRSATGGSFVPARDATLRPAAVDRPIEWFEQFNEFQQRRFVEQLRSDAELLSGSNDERAVPMGQRVAGLLEVAAQRSVPSILLSLAGLSGEIQALFSEVRDDSSNRLRRMLALQVNRDRALLDDLGALVTSLAETEEDLDDPDSDEEEDQPATPSRATRNLARRHFTRAVRAQALAHRRGRSVGTASRNGRILAWLRGRGIEFSELDDLGAILSLQGAARRLNSAVRTYIRGVPARYRAFRRERQEDAGWYVDRKISPAEISPLEVDLMLLAVLHNARSFLNEPRIVQALDTGGLASLEAVRGLYRNQILVDEATDFSPIQLACMAALANPRVESFFACGDFNQRLTAWGSRSRDQLEWVKPNIEFREITVSYRQSRRLNAFARQLMSPEAEGVISSLPDHIDNEGVAPVLGIGLSGSTLISWLTDRIIEIETFVGELPSIAILVNRKEELDTLAEALNTALMDQNIRVMACPDGQVMGQERDVRVFEVEHIKGLEFEAVFFVDIDRLETDQPDLFDKYLYVGATRAATYLGVTCGGTAVPERIAHVAESFADRW